MKSELPELSVCTKSELPVGMKSELPVGMKSELAVCMKSELSVGMKSELPVGMKSELSLYEVRTISRYEVRTTSRYEVRTTRFKNWRSKLNSYRNEQVHTSRDLQLYVIIHYTDMYRSLVAIFRVSYSKDTSSTLVIAQKVC